ncbi:acyl-CoA dehydrogenase family protein [Pseudomarimonas arenosa]|uniref:Acyl-CoA dehydrogenase family protein n=1 Tax=Pseudomarimonas arenosa TaxID=2774145 RepID=A0AAW3ZH00_9GAMM|nr:acyl-CoA dehydrogenase family protein [Pseudomarimonas arenosa]MBD8524824.1 acyl-CoA dehydrogenase family protein [Pseudomarimonas arenosa]
MSFVTHEVSNQVPELLPLDFWLADPVLREAVARYAPTAKLDVLQSYGKLCGGELSEAGFLANRYKPVLRTHDRFGHRIDQVEFHPAYHQLMRAAVEHGVHSHAWISPEPGGHVVRAALSYLHHQAEAGTSCPLTMTFAGIPVLRAGGAAVAPFLERAVSLKYEGEDRPALEKTGITLGMGMTEKQGGSDVRANSTRAESIGEGWYELTGHKWFFSAPMCDAFLVLAQAEAGLTCFLLPRWRPNGARNAIRIQRLKDKLGNWANASSEVEFAAATAYRLGDEGRGVGTILEMVSLTRLDCMLGSAAEMRRALVEAIHHSRHRRAFGHVLGDHSLMRSVLADLALESEAHTQLAMRVAAAVDAAPRDAGQAALARVATAIGKYWICKRAPVTVNEAQECLGGAGYVEESILPRLFRESPLNSIWEGCGNIQCLDVLRALTREAGVVEALQNELAAAAGEHPAFDLHCRALGQQLDEAKRDPEQAQASARRLTEHLALGLQASLMLRLADRDSADAFCRTRLGGEGGRSFGVLPNGLSRERMIDSALPDFA